MSGDNPLEGLGVVLTRPQAQCRGLADALGARGAHVIFFPALEITPVPLSESSRAALATLPGCALAVFVSANAAEHGIAAARAAGPWPSAVAVAAIGDATAARLREAGFEGVIAPATGFDSESLLACPELREVRGMRILIFRGVGGRERLRTTLEARGAKVDYVECYRRERPQTDATPLRGALARGEIAAVYAMSAETVDNFLALTGPQADWSGVTLVVPHPAIARHAGAAAFGQTMVAGPGAEGLVDAMQRLRKTA